MGTNTKIEWAHHTFNPWMGCTKVSPACDNCYAEAMMDDRMKVVQWGAGQPRKRTIDANWKLPLRWNAEAARLGIRYRVFCASLADVFDNEVPPAWRVDLLRLIDKTPNLDWLLLTKRIGNVNRMLDEAGRLMEEVLTWPKPNVWIGATIGNQPEADRDVPKLLDVRAAKRFLSIEPLLSSINLEKPMPGPDLDQGGGASICQPWMIQSGIDWVIVGGESGPNARPMHPDWARSLRDQCVSAGVPYFFKQWGEWEIASRANGHYDSDMKTNGAMWLDLNGKTASPSAIGLRKPYAMIKVGKKRAGRLLDGREWNEVPA